jgi:hypothetical protein
VTEEQIQALADCGLLSPKTEVGWRPAAGEEFPTKGTVNTVIFLMHIERKFGLLFFYSIELVHLVPNSIIIISTFIHLCEAYLGIASHFHLWRHFFELKKTGKAGVVRSVGSCCGGIALPDNTTGWKQGWFYLDNPTPALPTRTGRAHILYRSGPTSWRRRIQRSCNPCWTT